MEHVQKTEREFVQLVSPPITHYHHRIAKVVKLSYFLLSLCFNKACEGDAAARHIGGRRIIHWLLRWQRPQK